VPVHRPPHRGLLVPPHVINQVLLPAHRFAERAMLLQVCCRYEAALKASAHRQGRWPHRGVVYRGTRTWTCPRGLVGARWATCCGPRG